MKIIEFRHFAGESKTGNVNIVIYHVCDFCIKNNNSAVWANYVHSLDFVTPHSLFEK